MRAEVDALISFILMWNSGHWGVVVLVKIPRMFADDASPPSGSEPEVS